MKRISGRTARIARMVVLLAFIFSIGLSRAAVSAHANLLKSDPPMGAVLAQAPKTVRLEYTEDLDPALTRVRLLDRFSAVIAPGPGTVDPQDRRVLVLDLPDLGQGTYTAVWASRSATDGHSSAGSVVFSVGQASPDVSLLPPAGQAPPSTSLPAWPDVAVRWVLYLAAALLGGAVGFAQFVWRPAFQAWPGASLADDAAATGLFRRQALAGVLLLGIGTLVSALSQAALAGSGPAAAFQFILNPVSSWWVWLRLGLGAVTVVLLSRAPLAGGGQGLDAWRVMLLPVLAILASFSLTSHSAAAGALLPVLADLVHLAGMAAWFGGLPLLFLAVRRTRLPAAELVPLFSRLALVSVGLLGLTGLYSGLAHIASLEALFGTTYGAALLVKLGLFGGLFGLGALNLLVISPRLKPEAALAASPGASAGGLACSLRAEMALGVLLLGAVGVLTGSPPANDALQADQRVGYIGSYQAEGVTLNFWAAPAWAGDNELAVDVNDPRPQPAGQAAEVLVRFLNTQHNMGKTEVQAATRDGRRYTVRGSYLSMAGNWSVEVVLNVPGLDQISHPFAVNVAGDPNESTLPNPVAASPQSIAAGQAVYVEKCALCHGPTGQGDGPAGKVFNPRPADLSVHGTAGVHTDGQLFEWISQGIPGTAMAGFAGELSEAQRWNLVNFLHTLAKKP